jgi:hypothetical protein
MHHSESPVRYNNMGSYGESMVVWNTHIRTVQKNPLDNIVGVLIEHTFAFIACDQTLSF